MRFNRPMPPAQGHLWYWRILLKKSVRRIRQNSSGRWSALRKNELGPPRFTSIGRATSAVPSRCLSAALLGEKNATRQLLAHPRLPGGALATASQPARNNVGRLHQSSPLSSLRSKSFILAESVCGIWEKSIAKNLSSCQRCGSAGLSVALFGQRRTPRHNLEVWHAERL